MTSIYSNISRKAFKRSIFIAGIIIFVFIIYVIILKYEVEGENIEDMPFKVATITLASKIDTKKNNDSENLWNFNIMQINDIYITLEKNESIDENIKNVKIQNIIAKNKGIGIGKITRISNENNTNESLNALEYVGKANSSLENLSISKTGGTIGFRYIVENIGPYISNEEEIVYNMELLEKMGYSKEEIQTRSHI